MRGAAAIASGWPSRAACIAALLAALGLALALAACAPPPARPVDAASAPRLIAVERAPEGGLSYRLLRAEGVGPQRLLVWLHPSGASMNARVEALAPAFARRGFALLLPTGKQTREWTTGEANQLLGVTLPDAARLPGIDGRRPILMGFSAGGQVALLLWASAPARIGGLAVCGAAPLLMDGKRLVERAPPAAAGAARTPLLVVVGGQERSAARWDELGPRWAAAGVQLTVRVVPGEGHALLFDRQAEEELLRWLEERRGEGRGEGGGRVQEPVRRAEGSYAAAGAVLP